MAKLPPEPKSSEVTPPELYARRREFLRQGALYVATSAAVGLGLTQLSRLGSADPPKKPPPMPKPAPGSAEWRVVKRGEFVVPEAQTPYEDVTSYNNFYELGLSKSDPSEHAFHLKPRPWTLSITGHVAKPQTIDIDTLLRWFPLEERVYRMRCVEAWSMVIPWVGFPLADLIERFEPTSKAKYVAFKTLLDPVQLPGQESHVLAWLQRG
jgi:sulfoxide reductase catalytic subunit YedY